MTSQSPRNDDPRTGRDTGATAAGATNRSDRAAKIAAAGPSRASSRTRVLAGALVGLLILLGVGITVWQGRKSDPGTIANSASSASSSSSATDGPVGVPANGQGYVINTGAVKDGAPTIDVYEDFQCPICGAVHKILGTPIEDLAKSGDAKVVVHMMSFLDAKMNNSYSVPVANAAACAADQGKFLAFHDAAYADQKSEGYNMTPADIESYAKKAGVPDMSAFTACSTSNKHNAYVASIEDAASRAGVNGTPTIRINGTDFSYSKAKDEADLVAQFKAAVQAATKK